MIFISPLYLLIQLCTQADKKLNVKLLLHLNLTLNTGAGAPGQTCITSCQKYFDDKKYLLYCPGLADLDNLYFAKVRLKNEK